VTITRCKIHPAIGIARVGDSPDKDFIGPERPGRHDPPEGGHYKDAAGRIKRQAARFRIFAYDEDGEVVRAHRRGGRD
jgi:L-lysine epsilon oxidase-like protein